jgi:hypothetical protein
MGERTLRRLLIIGSSAVVLQASKRGAPKGSWLEQMLLQRRRGRGCTMVQGQYTAQVTRLSPAIRGVAAGTPGAAATVSKQALIGELPTPSFLADVK